MTWKQPKNWRWMPNMTAIDRDTGVRGIVVWVGVNTLSVMRPGALRPQTVRIVDAIPDRECPATLGCMLAIARELWGDPVLRAQARWKNGQWRWSLVGGKFHSNAFSRMAERLHPTEFDALWAAIDGAP